MMSELKDCPCCGAEPILMRMSKRWVIGCPDCELEISAWTGSLTTTCQIEKAKLRAIEAWNSRPLEDQLTTKVERLSEALESQSESIKTVIDQLFKTGCDEAWSITKLNNTLREIEELKGGE